MRLTFSQPLVNPVIATNGGRGAVSAFGVAGDPVACIVSMQHFRFAGVNGQPPQPGQIVVNSLGQAATFDSSTLSLGAPAPVLINPDPTVCNVAGLDPATISGTSYFQVNGVISSIDVVSDIYSTIVRDLSRRARSISPRPLVRSARPGVCTVC